MAMLELITLCSRAIIYFLNTCINTAPYSGSTLIWTNIFFWKFWMAFSFEMLKSQLHSRRHAPPVVEPCANTFFHTDLPKLRQQGRVR